MKFKGGIHTSGEGLYDATETPLIHSDTLFSAICCTAAMLYGNEFTTELLKEGNFILSSAFPFFRESLLLPRPLNFLPEISQERYSLRKAFKKTRFIPLRMVEDILNGNLEITGINENDLTNQCLLPCSPGTCSRKFYVRSEIPRVTIDRIDNSPSIYHFTELRFDSEAGLYFFAEVKKALQEKFLASLRLLGDEGIGGDRTAGKGLFSIETETILLNLPQKPEAFLLISTYLPASEELKDFLPERSFYEIKARGGWISNSSYKRRTFRMFTEGSVLSFRNKNYPKGQVLNAYCNLEEAYQVFRNAQAFVLPIGGENV
ncbi:MAG: type III-A CRISPR-associated RAMP protein Csm4 [Ignavibacteria bacterium]|nr:type III-A CRISPR-associated RAMP protein Csm4 [Ignavibacteria bacterium]